MRKPKDIKDLTHKIESPWFEFENNFEEGWTDNPLIPTLANLHHHNHVANVVANQLNLMFESDTEFANHFQDSVMVDKVLGEYYVMAARILYPADPIFYGDMGEAYFKYQEDNNL